MDELRGRTYVVTGANTGVGRVTAHELARLGAQVVLACRSEAKTTPVIDEIRATTGNAAVEFVPLDLASLVSVRACAEALLARDLPIHGLINNAGLAGARGLTADGFELAFGTNHLGPYLLTRLLLDRLRASAPARVVNVASVAHRKARGIDWDAVRRPTRSRTGLPEYQVSKLCNVLTSRALARRLEGTGVTTYALHPGVVATDVWRQVPAPVRWVMKRFMITPAQGARTQLWCATAPELADHSGRYYDAEREQAPSALAQDDALAEELWARSAELVGLPA
ncbi:MAG: SDR family oxidoreductase [Kofleriaceae bacterium]